MSKLFDYTQLNRKALEATMRVKDKHLTGEVMRRDIMIKKLLWIKEVIKENASITDVFIADEVMTKVVDAIDFLKKSTGEIFDEKDLQKTTIKVATKDNKACFQNGVMVGSLIMCALGMFIVAFRFFI